MGRPSRGHVALPGAVLAQVADELGDAIVAGQLAPGEALRSPANHHSTSPTRGVEIDDPSS
jgi:hypothetical protein